MDLRESSLPGPLPEPPPAGTPGGQIDGDVLPAGAGADQPEDPFQALAVVGPGPTAFRGGWVLGKVGGDSVPLVIGL
jgi:hypothetical protein